MCSDFCLYHITLRTPLSFFFNDTATTEIYTLSLHDALPISAEQRAGQLADFLDEPGERPGRPALAITLAVQPPHLALELGEDRKSTRLNSSHANISYAVFCLKKKKISFTRLTTTKTNTYIIR